MNKNVRAFLDMIAISEIGKTLLAKSDNGYDVLYGGTLFDNYADHPRIAKTYLSNGRSITSTAAGRYQILARNYDFYKKQLKLTDFSPASQDAIAIQLIKECKALTNVELGNFQLAVKQCAHIWASLPGAGYDQPENKMSDLQTAYVKAGGKVGSA